MRALTFVPGTADSARLEQEPEPPIEDGAVLVDTLAIGVCGTDMELVEGQLGWLSPDCGRLILGHESLGRVREAPPNCGLVAGDLIVGIVRRPDPVPCINCAVDEWDLCRNDQYVERGIKQRNGYASERFRIEPEFAVKVNPKLGTLGVLLEPASVLAKAWDHIDRIGHRGRWEPRTLLVTGAGPIGLLAALMGAQRGLDVHVLDIVTDGPKPGLVHDLGATYHTSSVEAIGVKFDVIIECAGVGSLLVEAINQASPNGILCLIGGGCGDGRSKTDINPLAGIMMHRNLVMFGSVSANRRHFQAGAEALAQADRDWLARLITRRVPLDRWSEALERRPNDVKTVIAINDE